MAGQRIPLGFEPDVEVTQAGYRMIPSIDPRCCNACATFTLALNSGALPKPLMALLEVLGADPAKPLEPWGAPDGGFLQVWWPFVRPAALAVNLADEEQEVVLGEGESLRITFEYPRPNWTVTSDRSVPAVEFTWRGAAVRDLERKAWMSS